MMNHHHAGPSQNGRDAMSDSQEHQNTRQESDHAHCLASQRTGKQVQNRPAVLATRIGHPLADQIPTRLGS